MAGLFEIKFVTSKLIMIARKKVGSTLHCCISN